MGISSPHGAQRDYYVYVCAAPVTLWQKRREIVHAIFTMLSALASPGRRTDVCVRVPIIMSQWGLNALVSMGTFTVKPKMEVLTVGLLFQDLTFGFSVRIRFRLGLVLRLSCSFGWEERRTVGFNQWKGSVACRSKKPRDLLYIYPLLLTQCGPKLLTYP